MSACFDFFAVSKCAYTLFVRLRLIYTFQTNDRHFWDFCAWGILMFLRLFLLYVYVNKLVKMTDGIIRWKYERGIYLPRFDIIWISMISNIMTVWLHINYQFLSTCIQCKKCRNYAHLLSCELCVMVITLHLVCKFLFSNH